MNKSFVIALALILALIKGSNGNSRLLLEDKNENKPNYKPRKNEAECSSRRCCSMRDELTSKDLPDGLNCHTLSDYECGQYDRYCEWDCNQVNPMRNNKNIQRKFRGITSKDGSYQEPVVPEHDDVEYDNKKLLEKCLSEGGKFIAIDDCGVEYEEQVKDFDVICHKLYGNDEEHDEDERRRLWVIGSDGRTQVTNMDVYPYDTVLRMEGETTRSKWGCTATMISPDIAITAAHCVWGEGELLDVKFAWSIDNCNEFQQQVRAGHYYLAETYWVWSAYTQPGGNSAANDIALLRFNTNGRSHNYMGFGPSFNSAQAFKSIGYPQDKDVGACTPYEQECKYQSFSTDVMATTDCDHWHGQSGSGITQNNVIHGILSRGTDEGVFPAENYDCLITPAKHQWICQYTGTCN